MTARKSNALNGLSTAKNSRTGSVFGRSHSIVAFLFRVIKGEPEAVLLVAGFIPSGSESKNSWCLLLADLELSADRER